MNNDRATSFLCSFQTFQTFNVVCTRAQVHCATRDTEHLPGGVQPNLQYVTWYSLVPRHICRRLAWATLPRALFPEGTDRRPFLLQRVVFFLILSFLSSSSISPSSFVNPKRKGTAPLLLLSSPTWRAGMSLSLSPFGPRLITHHITPACTCMSLSTVPPAHPQPSSTDANQRPSTTRYALYRVRCLTAHWPLTWPPWRVECAGSA